MQLSKLLQTQKAILAGFQFLIIALLVLGIFFRFVNLDRKVYWLDETHTSLRIFGYTEPEFIQQNFSGNVVTTENLLKFQNPSADKSLADTVRVLSGNTEHTPLYYLMASLWGRWFGGSVAVIRSLSALISLLALPCAYWLCQELFGSALVGWIAIALLSVSPLQALFSQEARPYSLLTVAILASSAALLQALRRSTSLHWGLYAATVAAGLYSHWFFSLVAIGHGIYVLVTERLRPTRLVIAYVLASIAGLIAFTPWIWLVLTSPPPLEKQMGWVFQKMPLSELAHAWVLNISRSFYDLDRGICIPIGSGCRYVLGFDDPLAYIVFVPILALVAYSIYFLCRKTPVRVWLFVLLMITITALALALPDLIKGGQRSSVTRYQVACSLGIQMAIAYCLASHLTSFNGRVWQQRFWRLVLFALVSIGIMSCAVSAEAQAWWSKGGNYHVAPISNVLNTANKPLVLYSVPSDVVWGKGGAVGRVVPLARFLKPDVGLLFVVEPNVPPQIPEGFQDMFVYRPHQELRTWLEQRQDYQLEPVKFARLDDSPRLWTLKKQQ